MGIERAMAKTGMADIDFKTKLLVSRERKSAMSWPGSGYLRL